MEKLQNSASCRMMKSREAANYLAISERKLWELTKNDRIPVVRIDRSVRYDKADLDEFIQQCKNPHL